MKKNKILICGSDGYIGYSLAMHLTDNKYTVLGIDNFSRREAVESVGSDSLIPLRGRKVLWEFKDLSLLNYSSLKRIIKTFYPDVIVHLAEQPSAPYSMKNQSNATLTQINNIVGTLNLLWAMKETECNAHLVKIGTMGEYSDWIYQDTIIPENKQIKVKYENKEIEIPYPRFSNSFYHFSKIFDSYNIEFISKIWGFRVTDIMQGIVYGLQEGTRFDYDEYFGTIINRFIVQAIVGIPLTIYGEGGQTRGFLPLKDSIQCLKLIIDNSPKDGEYRIINQLEGIYKISDLANCVKEVGDSFGLNVKIQNVKNPRIEKEKHNYKVEHKKLLELGYKPTTNMKAELFDIFKKLFPYKERIRKNVILPKTQWK